MGDTSSSAFSAPVIVRIAGLPAEVMEPFSSPACMEMACSLARLDDQLASARAQMVDRLHEQVPVVPPAARRVLLAVKRDCFNGRSLAPRRRSRAWALVQEAAPLLGERIADLEDRLAAESQAFEKTFRAERERQRCHLLRLLEEENLARGLALASPTLLGGAGRLDKPVASFGRKERSAEQSLLRYASRAALKLSPFSTLTRLGVGAVTDRLDEPTVQLVASAWSQRRLLRVKKEILNQCYTLLLHHPIFRRRLRIGLNGTVEKVGTRRYRFVRPAHWFLDRKAEALNYRQDALIAVDLGGPLIEELETLLAESLHFGDLIELVASRLNRDEAEVESRVDTLLDLGFVQLLSPWATHELDQDRKLLQFLESLPPDVALAELARALGRILELGDADVPTGALASAVEAIDAATSRGLQALNGILGLATVEAHPARRRMNEDVLLVSSNGAGGQEIALVARRSAERAIASAIPLLRYRNLRSNRYNFLHTLQAIAVERWPGRRDVGFLELFEAMQPLWRDFLRAMKTSRREKRWVSWNPLGLPSIDELQRLRETLHDELQNRQRQEGEDQVLRREEAEEVMARIPDLYAPVLGPCLFVQPAEQARDLWVVNRLLDGTGRYSSRYTAVMDEPMRERYTSHLLRRGVVRLDGEQVDLVDILCARANHLNVHAVQTPRVLEMPGELSDLPSDRRLGLQDLRVLLDRPLPVLVDLAGRRILPVFLGTVSLMVMPMLLRFLSQFGIGEFSLSYPSRPPIQRGDAEFCCRLRVGNLIVRRRRWIFEPAAVLDRCAGGSDDEFFRVANRWRLALGIPDRAFISEKLPVEFFGVEVHKPQYIDFTSPSFTQVLRAALGSKQTRLTIEEMLPTPEAFPRDRNRRTWAFEVQLESIIFNDAAAPSRREVHENAGSRRSTAVGPQLTPILKRA